MTPIERTTPQVGNIYRIDGAVRYLRIDTLKEDPNNSDYHSDFDPYGKDSALCDDIEKHGVLLPVLLQPDGQTLRDGHRRKRASEHCGLTEIPAVIMSDDSDAVFLSAQMHRNLSIFAKCKLHRSTIEALVKRGNASKGQASDEELADDWDKLVAVLGVNRNMLQRGVRILARIEELQGAGSAKAIRQATLIETTFRNRGFKPAAELAFGGAKGEDDEDEGESLSPTPIRRDRKAAKKKAAPDDGPETFEELAAVTFNERPRTVVTADSVEIVKAIVGPFWGDWDYKEGTIALNGTFTAMELRALCDLLDTQQLEQAL